MTDWYGYYPDNLCQCPHCEGDVHQYRVGGIDRDNLRMLMCKGCYRYAYTHASSHPDEDHAECAVTKLLIMKFKAGNTHEYDGYFHRKFDWVPTRTL